MSQVPNTTLNNDVEIPQLGFGVFQIPAAQTKDATLEALRVGYRHIDTAQMYRNEVGVGQAVRESGLPRAEVFVTSKLSNRFHDPDDALAAFDRTLEALDIGYLDLFLIHWPLASISDFVPTWKALEQMLASGRVRAIGVSNFQVPHLERLAAETDTVPAVNQIEIHPYFTNETVRGYDAEHGIATEAWSPIAQGKVLDDPVIVRVAEAAGRTPAQVTLRWHLQRGDIVFPKSVTPARVRENYELFDFELDEQQMDDITGLNRDERTGGDPDTMTWIPEN
jgi:2,5-diketo-D-gluconate reductase A